jgi:cytochrome P450
LAIFAFCREESCILRSANGVQFDPYASYARAALTNPAAKQYGDVFCLKIFNQTMIVLNSPSIVREVVDKRSMSTANRPKSIIADMITPHNMNLGTAHYGLSSINLLASILIFVSANETWKVLRKAAMFMLSKTYLKQYEDLQIAEARQLVWNFADDPQVFSSLTRCTSTLTQLHSGLVSSYSALHDILCHESHLRQTRPHARLS